MVAASPAARLMKLRALQSGAAPVRMRLPRRLPLAALLQMALHPPPVSVCLQAPLRARARARVPLQLLVRVLLLPLPVRVNWYCT